MTNLETTAIAMQGGADESTGVGSIHQVVVGDTWTLDDTFTLTFTVNKGRSYQFGAGQLTNQNPTFCLTYKKKLYLLGGGATMFFSALEEPTIFNDPNQAGNSFMDLSNEYGFSSDMLGAAIYQGGIATFARQSIQIIEVDADPANYKVRQTLENIGTVNGASVRGIGDLDVIFCADSGFRSLRVRDSSNNASIMDLGTPIDSLVQARLLSAGIATMASIVEPISGRYWCAIGNLIYVFSYFPASGVTAWSTYVPAYWTAIAPDGANYDVDGIQTATVSTSEPTYWAPGANDTSLTYPDTFGNPASNTTITVAGYFTPAYSNVTLNGTASAAVTATLKGQTTFTPEKFVERSGQVYVRSTVGKIYRYGGDANATYDESPCSWETPWLDARSAATQKLGNSADAGLEGGWKLSLGMDPVSAVLKEVYRNTVSTYGRGVVPSSMRGNHFKVRGVSYGADYARFSTFAFHFGEGDSR